MFRKRRINEIIDGLIERAKWSNLQGSLRYKKPGDLVSSLSEEDRETLKAATSQDFSKRRIDSILFLQQKLDIPRKKL